MDPIKYKQQQLAMLNITTNATNTTKSLDSSNKTEFALEKKSK